MTDHSDHTSHSDHSDHPDFKKFQMAVDKGTITQWVGLYITLKGEKDKKQEVRETFEHMFQPARKVLEKYMIIATPCLTVISPCCGQVHEYVTIDDLPLVDVPCECGKEGCFIIKYEEEK